MIIARDPLYQPGDDLSPRMRTAFSEAKKRLLPSIVQQQYADAKGAFDRKEFESAASGFRRVMDALNDPDMGSAASKPPLADLRTLAAGFHDLSVKAIPPAPTPAPAPSPSPLQRRRQRPRPSPVRCPRSTPARNETSYRRRLLPRHCRSTPEPFLLAALQASSKS